MNSDDALLHALAAARAELAAVQAELAALRRELDTAREALRSVRQVSRVVTPSDAAINLTVLVAGVPFWQPAPDYPAVQMVRTDIPFPICLVYRHGDAPTPQQLGIQRGRGPPEDCVPLSDVRWYLTV